MEYWNCITPNRVPRWWEGDLGLDDASIAQVYFGNQGQPVAIEPRGVRLQFINPPGKGRAQRPDFPLVTGFVSVFSGRFLAAASDLLQGVQCIELDAREPDGSRCHESFFIMHSLNVVECHDAERSKWDFQDRAYPSGRLRLIAPDTAKIPESLHFIRPKHLENRLWVSESVCARYDSIRGVGAIFVSIDETQIAVPRPRP